MQTTLGHADYLESLNPRQRQAAVFGIEDAADRGVGPLLVIAGAGTGKTMTLAHRVAHVVVSGTNPERILLLTFTRRAAEEMSRRVDTIVHKALAGDGSRRLPAGVLPWCG